MARGLMHGLERDTGLAVENSHLAADAFRVLSYALSHPDSIVAVCIAVSHHCVYSLSIPFSLAHH